MTFNIILIVNLFMSDQSHCQKYSTNTHGRYSLQKFKRHLVDRATNTDLSYASMRLKERNVMHVRIRNMNELKDCLLFGEELGRGNFARVVAVKDRCKNEEWALKIIEKPSATDKMKYVRHEIDILKMVNHPNIIYLDKVYESSSELFLLLEKCDSSLLTEFKKVQMFREKDVKKLIKQMGGAIAYLHKHDIVHRDIKLENVLLGKNPKNPKDRLFAKLTDFGLSILKSGVGISSMMHDFCGTLIYMAPEMLTKPSYSHQCDVWSLGVLMYILLTGQMPFDGADDQEVMNKIINKDPTYEGVQVSKSGLNMLQRMLEKEPANRIAASEIMIHGWINDNPGQKDLGNVFDMMKRWKSDLRVVPQQNAPKSDWVSPTHSIDETVQSSTRNLRPAASVTIQNIEFHRNRNNEQDNEKTTTTNLLKELRPSKSKEAGTSKSPTDKKSNKKN